jgi:hypothetical protein
VCFGHVLEGTEVVDKMTKYGNYRGEVKKNIVISDCGIAKDYIERPVVEDPNVFDPTIDPRDHPPPPCDKFEF